MFKRIAMIGLGDIGLPTATRFAVPAPFKAGLQPNLSAIQKPNRDDLRQSPAVSVIRQLAQLGCQVLALASVIRQPWQPFLKTIQRLARAWLIGNDRFFAAVQPTWMARCGHVSQPRLSIRRSGRSRATSRPVAA